MNNSASDFFNPDPRISKCQRWKHAGYYVVRFVKCCFSHPLKKESPDLDLLGIVRSLLDDFRIGDNKENIDKTKELLALHRMLENTQACRRLEKWSLRVIALYLFAVFLIVLGTYTKSTMLHLPLLVIPNPIMIAILTTTTANIIGLGLIVLRGHFLANDKK